MGNDERELDDLFAKYRSACPDVTPDADFMPGVWRRIDARHGFWFAFQGLARTAATAAAALCLLLLLLNLASAPASDMVAATYADALAADHTAERTYYTEAIRDVQGSERPAALPHGHK